MSETDTTLWHRVRETVLLAIGVVVVVGLLVGPPVVALYTHWGDPLWVMETTTITVTRPRGAIVGVLEWLIPWAGLWFLISMANGVAPKRI